MKKTLAMLLMCFTGLAHAQIKISVDLRVDDTLEKSGSEEIAEAAEGAEEAVGAESAESEQVQDAMDSEASEFAELPE